MKKRKHSDAWFKGRALANRAYIFISGMDRYQQYYLDRYDKEMMKTFINDNRWMIRRMWKNDL